MSVSGMMSALCSGECIVILMKQSCKSIQKKNNNFETCIL